MQHKRVIFISILILLFTTFLTRLIANDPSVIPDYVNYPKYEKIYQEFKSISDEKRAYATQLLDAARLVDEKMSQNQKQLAHNKNKIKESRNSITFMTKEIPRMQADNVRHKYQIEVNQQTILQKKETIKELELVVYDDESEIKIAKEIYESAYSQRLREENRYNNINDEIYSLSQKIQDTKNRLSEQRNQLHNTKNEIERLRQLIHQQKVNKRNSEEDLNQILDTIKIQKGKKHQIQREIEVLKTTLGNLNTKIATLNQQLSDVENELNTLQNQTNSLMGKIENKTTAHSTLKRQYQEQSQKLSKQQQRQSNLNTKINNQKYQVTVVKDNLTKNQNNLFQLLESSAANQKVIFQKNQEIWNEQNQIGLLLEKSSKLQFRINNITRRIQKKQQGIADHLARKNQLQRRINRVSGKIAQQEEARLALLNQKSTKQINISDLGKKIANKQNRIEKLAASEDPEKESKIATLKNQITNLQSKIDQLKNDISALDQQISPIDQKITDLNSRLTNLQTKLAGETAEIEPVNAEIAQLKTKVENFEQQITELHSSVALHESNISGLESQINSLKKQVTNTNTKIKNLKDRISNQQNKLVTLENKIIELERTLITVKQNIDGSVQGLERKTLRLTKLSSLIEDLKSQRSQLQNLKSSVRTEIQKLKKEIGRTDAEINTKRNRKNKLEEIELVQVNQSLARLHEKQEEETSFMSRMRNEIAENEYQKGNLEWTIPGLERSFDSLTATIEGQYRNLNMLEATGLQVKGDLQNAREIERQKREIYDAKLNKKAGTLNRIAGLKNNIRDLYNENSFLTTTIKQNIATSEHYEVKIVELEELIVTLKKKNKELVAYISLLKSKAKIAWEKHTQAENNALKAEEETALKLAKLKEVKDNYQNQLQLAKDKGLRQGEEQGYLDGKTPGENLGQQEGFDTGRKIGIAEGHLFGYRKGLLDGLILGEEEGYQNGKKAPQNHEAGFSLGAKQGKKNAYTTAHQAHFTPCRKERKQQLLQTLPTRKISLNGEPAPSYGSNYHPIKVPYTPPFEGADLAEFSQDEALEESIAAIKHDAHQVQNQIDQLPSEVEIDLDGLKIEIPEDVSGSNCSADYTDFINACLTEYKKAYQVTYQTSFKESYEIIKQPAFLIGKEKGFKEAKESKWKEGKDISYPITYQKWDQIGAFEYQKVGYGEGLIKGYEEHLEQARLDECKAGYQAEEVFFQQNPVLRMVDADVSKPITTTADGSFIAGDELVINVGFANYGDQTSKKGLVEVKAEALTSNVLVQSHPVKVISLPGNTVTTVKNLIKARIKWTTVYAEEIRILVTARMPDGVKNQKIIRFATKLHLTSEMEFRVFKEKPKVFYRHFIRLHVKNNTQAQAQKGYKVILTAPEREGFAILIHEAITNPLASGESQEIKLKYVLRSKQLIGKPIPLTFTVYYQGSVSSKITKTIIPRSKW